MNRAPREALDPMRAPLDNESMDDPTMVRLEIRALLVDPDSKAPVVVLEESGAANLLPIWIGPFEALALSRALQGETPERPLTHELLGRVIQDLGADLHSVAIVALEGSTFIGELRLERADGSVIRVDSRPSDAITLATRFGVPIFASRPVVEKGKTVHVEDESEEERLRRLLEALDPSDSGGYTM